MANWPSLERDVATREGAPPTAQWLADLDRIERAVAQIYTPTEFASEAYTLRQHVDFVRQAVVTRSSAKTSDPFPDSIGS